MPAPAALNILLLLAVQVFTLTVLWVVSRLDWIWAIPIGMAASFILLTNYALLHEAAHDNLHPDAGANRFWGTLSGWLFPVSFTFLQISHRVHHRNNRTDYEMFDYYYPGDNLLIKYAQWYSILIGIYPPIIPVGSILMAFTPWVYDAKPFANARSSAVLFANNQFLKPDIAKIRTEVIGGAIYWLLVWNLLSLNPLPVLIVYACFCFNWSTRQYVTHAFTPRDVIGGAFNLQVGRLTGWILLNGQWDQVHHKYPQTPWLYLPSHAGTTMEPVSYWRQYLKMWKGPRPNFDAAPRPLDA
jgi:fatty acid desaturase